MNTTYEPIQGNFNEDGEDFKFKGWEQIKDETFSSYLKLLIQRSNHLETLDPESFDYKSYRDLCLVMLRAIIIESPTLSNNFTVQNFLIRHNEPKLATSIDSYLNQDINKIYTVRTAIKTCVDKFIAHNDAITKVEAGEENLDHKSIFIKQLYTSDLSRKDFPFTIAKIVQEIRTVVGKVINLDELDTNSMVL